LENDPFGVWGELEAGESGGRGVFAESEGFESAAHELGVHESFESAESFLAFGGLRGCGVLEFAAAETDHEMMLVGEAGQIEALRFGVEGEPGKIDMGGEIGFADCLEGIIVALMVSIGGQSSLRTFGAVINFLREAVIEGENETFGQFCGQRVDPGESVEVDLGLVIFDLRKG
jgi:hypothetical protein